MGVKLKLRFVTRKPCLESLEEGKGRSIILSVPAYLRPLIDLTGYASASAFTLPASSE